MITDFFLRLPYYFLSWFIGLLPAAKPLPGDIMASAQLIGTKIGIFEPVMPLVALSSALGILFSAQVAIWTWQGFKWLSSHIPFIGGHK